MPSIRASRPTRKVKFFAVRGPSLHSHGLVMVPRRSRNGFAYFFRIATRRAFPLALLILFSTGVSLSQALNDPMSQNTPSNGVDCSDPSMAGSSQCAAGQGQGANARPRRWKFSAGQHSGFDEFRQQQRRPIRSGASAAEPFANRQPRDDDPSPHGIRTDGGGFSRTTASLVRPIAFPAASKHIRAH